MVGLYGRCSIQATQSRYSKRAWFPLNHTLRKWSRMRSARRATLCLSCFARRSRISSGVLRSGRSSSSSLFDASSASSFASTFLISCFNSLSKVGRFDAAQPYHRFHTNTHLPDRLSLVCTRPGLSVGSNTYPLIVADKGSVSHALTKGLGLGSC